MARVHPVYLDWCRKFSKEPNDSRFATFASNYIKQENAKAREDKAEAESVAKAREEARFDAEAVANAEEEAEALNLENEARQRLAEKEASRSFSSPGSLSSDRRLMEVLRLGEEQ